MTGGPCVGHHVTTSHSTLLLARVQRNAAVERNPMKLLGEVQWMMSDEHSLALSLVVMMSLRGSQIKQTTPCLTHDQRAYAR